ncbi:MAG: hypothetical protein WA906_00515 [Pacificimonas sp.]
MTGISVSTNALSAPIDELSVEALAEAAHTDNSSAALATRIVTLPPLFSTIVLFKQLRD